MQTIRSRHILAFEVIVILSIAVFAFSEIRQDSITGLYAGSYIGDLTVSTDKAVYSHGNFAVIMASLFVNTLPVSDTDVSINIVKPDGTVTSKYLRTDTNGNAVYTHVLTAEDKPGVYAVIATASRGGRTATAKTTFNFL